MARGGEGRQIDGCQTLPYHGPITSTAHSLERDWASDFGLRLLCAGGGAECLTEAVAPRDQHRLLSPGFRSQTNRLLSTAMHLRRRITDHF